MFNPLEIIRDVTSIFGIEWAGAGVLAFGVSLAVYSLIHAGKVNF